MSNSSSYSPPSLPPTERLGWPWAADTTTSPLAKSVGDLADLPRITVVTPSFNQGQFLEQTIRSVLLQGYPNLEYIVVDGGSSDQSHAILDRYAPWIDHTIREPDEGQSDAICKGLRLATGDLFNWINSDDTLLPGTLWELAEDFDLKSDLYTFPVLVEGEGVDSYTMLNSNLVAKVILRDERYSFSQPGVWFRLKQLVECGGIDRSLNYGFDWDLLVRYLAYFPRVQYSKSPGAMFRLHDQSKTVVENAKDDREANRFKQEKSRIRDKLEAGLPRQLSKASQLGRRREPWHQNLVEILDHPARSPIQGILQIMKQAWSDPRARLSPRTFGAIVRLISRYVRPGFRK